jgi:hypothetical protein
LTKHFEARLPDPLFKRVKAGAALRGMKLRDLSGALLNRRYQWFAERKEPPRQAPARPRRRKAPDRSDTGATRCQSLGFGRLTPTSGWHGIQFVLIGSCGQTEQANIGSARYLGGTVSVPSDFSFSSAREWREKGTGRSPSLPDKGSEAAFLTIFTVGRLSSLPIPS